MGGIVGCLVGSWAPADGFDHNLFHVSLWWGATREDVLWVGLLWDPIGGPPTGGSAHDSWHTQRVVLDGLAMGPVSVLSGVPRGLDWGPILFLVFVGGLPRVIGSSVHRQLCPVWEHVFDSGLSFCV